MSIVAVILVPIMSFVSGSRRGDVPVWPENAPNGPPSLDPRLVEALPSEADQKMVGVPDCLLVEASAYYSFGTAIGPDGSVYFTEFNRSRLQRLTPSGQLGTVLSNKGPMYGVAADEVGNVFVGLDSDNNTGGILRIARDGTTSLIVTNLTRPRQLTCDSAGNLYFVLEAGREIRKWNHVNHEVETVFSGLKIPQGVAVGPDGSIYFSEYGSMGPRGIALEPGSLNVLRPSGSVEKVAEGFWRARGIAIAASGDLYLATEANAWDQGNSGVLFRIAPDGNTEAIAKGLDYPQFPAVGKDGTVYFTLARDNLLVSYDPRSQFIVTPWPGHASITGGIRGAEWVSHAQNTENVILHLTVQDLSLEAPIRPLGSGEPMAVWVRIPAELLEVSREQKPYPSPEVRTMGIFTLPSVSCRDARKAFVMPVREHRRSRWPVRFDDAGKEWAADDFGEEPVAYLVYVEYPSQDPIAKEE